MMVEICDFPQPATETTYDPQAAYSSSSRNVKKGVSIKIRMVNLSLSLYDSLNDFQTQIPTHLSPPTSFSFDTKCPKPIFYRMKTGKFDLVFFFLQMERGYF
jgi:hypothetical protein